MSNRLLDRIATLNFNVIRCVHQHPLQAHKYLNGGKVRVVITPSLHKLICDPAAEKDVVKYLKDQFKGRLCDQDVSQVGFFNYRNLKLGWIIQAISRENESLLAEDVFDTKSNIYWVLISTARGLKNHHINRIQKVKTKRNNYE